MRPFRSLVRGFGIAALVLGLLSALVWVTLPYLVKAVGRAIAERNGMESVTIDIGALRWDHAVVHRLAFTAATPHGPISAALRDVTVRYRATAMSLNSVFARSADITWPYVPASSPAAPVVPWPLFPITDFGVHDLRLQIDAPWGSSRLTGRLSVRQEDDRLTAELRDRRQTLHIVAEPALRSVTIEIASGDHAITTATIQNPLAPTVGFEVTAALHRLGGWSRDNPMLPEPVSASLQDLGLSEGSLSMSGELQQLPEKTTVRATGELNWRNWQWEGLVLSGQVRYQLQHDGGHWQIQALPHSGMSLGEGRWGDQQASLKISPVDFEFESEMELGLVDNEWRLTVPRFSARAEALELFADPETPLRTGRLKLDGTLSPSGSLNRVRLRAVATAPRLPSLSVVADTLDVSADFDTDRQLRANGPFTLTGLRMTGWPASMRGLSLVGRYQARDRTLSAHGQARIGDRPAADWRLTPLGRTGTQLSMTIDTPVPTAWGYLKPLAGPAWRDLSLTTGALSGWARIDWNPDVAGQLELRGSGVQGRYDKAEFQDLELEFNSEDIRTLDYRVRLGVKHAQAASGTRVADAAAAFRWRDQALLLTTAGFRAWGGEFKVDSAHIDLAQGSGLLPMRVSGLDLGALLAEIDQPGLSGNGRLTGAIPLEFAAGAIRVGNAELQSTAPGVLRYRPAAGPQPQLENIALQALQNFQYDSLNMQLGYDLNGDYRIKMRLEGRNPDLYSGYPIAFNLKFTGTLPGLLQASLLSGDFSGQILKNLKAQPQTIH